MKVRTISRLLNKRSGRWWMDCMGDWGVIVIDLDLFPHVGGLAMAIAMQAVNSLICVYCCIRW